jgi:predicted nucleic acid-binding protein
MFEEDFQGRILPFDSDATAIYANLASARRQEGHPISFADAQIAAITLSRGGRLATRNDRDFAGGGIEIVNPWDA